MNGNVTRHILMGAILLAVVATAAHSAGMSSSVRFLGGTGGMTVSSPTSATAYVTWQSFDSSGNATVARVRWTPSASGNYTVSVYVFNSGGAVLTSGSASIVGAGTSQRNDNVTLASAAPIANIASVRVRIAQD